MKAFLLFCWIMFPVVPLEWLPRQVSIETILELADVAQRMELADSSECWRAGLFRSELQWCRRRYLETRDCPPLWIVRHLPPHDLCCGLSAAWYDHAEQCRWKPLLRWSVCDWSEIRGESLRRWRWWELAAKATDSARKTSDRRQALRELADTVGGVDVLLSLLMDPES